MSAVLWKTPRTLGIFHKTVWRINSEYGTLGNVDEGRKRVLLIAASILAARKLSQYDAGPRVPATICAIADAIHWAEEIMNEIDRRWPAIKWDQPHGRRE